MGRNIKILVSLVIFSIVYSLYYWGIPAVVNLPKHTKLIEQAVQKETGFKIEIENPKLKMGILPSVCVSVDNSSIINDDGSKAFYVENLKVNIKLLPLILRHIDVSDLKLSKVDINLVLDKDKNLKLGQYELKNIENKFALRHVSAQVDDYNVFFKDDIQNKKIDLDGHELVIKNYRANKHIDIKTSADITVQNKKSGIDVDLDLKLPVTNISSDQLKLAGNITNLDIADFSDYINLAFDNKIKSVSGVINMKADTKLTSDKHKNISLNSTIENLNIFTGDIKTSIYSREKLDLKTDLYTIKNGIKIKELKLSGKGISLVSSGVITKLNSPIPHIDLKVGVGNSKVEDFLNILPPSPDISPDINLLVLKKAGFWGDVKGNLEIRGKADYPNVYGNVIVSNAYMVKPIENSEKATIKLSFIGDKMNMDVRVPTSPTQTVWVKGPIDLDKDRAADLNITSTDNVDLKTAQIVLNPLHDVFAFELGPVPIMDIKGLGGINLHITGTKKNPHGWGQFRFKNAIVSFLDIHNLVIANGEGTLDFNDQDTLFKTTSATLEGKPVSIKGTCSLMGDFNFNAESNGQDIGKLLNTVKTSPMLKEVQGLVKPFESMAGMSNIKLNLTGHVKDINDIKFNKNIFAKGSIQLISDTIKFSDVPLMVTGTSGVVNFNNLDANFNLKSLLGSSIVNINGFLKDDKINIKLASSRFNLGDGIKAIAVKIPFAKDLSTINTNFTAIYNGKIDDIEYEKLYLKGKIFSNMSSKSRIVVNNSDFELNNSNLKLPLLKGSFNGSPFNISLNMSNAFSDKRIVTGNAKISAFDLNLLNDKNILNIIPKEQAKMLGDIEFENGKIDISARAWANNYNVYSVLDNIKLLYKPQEMDLEIKSGNLLLHNNILNLNKINAQLSQSPIFIDGKIFNVFNKPNLSLYINLKPTQELFDQTFNKTQVYPIKLKGDAILSSKIIGYLNNINAKSTLDIAEKSSLYYMGATIGDVENPVKITLDNNYSSNKIKINDLQYDKIILSQNNKPFVKTQLNSSGTLILLPNNNIGFNNFKIKTQNPTDAKIFNIIFRKPFMKQGVFNSDIVMNGTALNPKINGKLNITSIDIPFFDSTIRDINLDFKNDKINISSKGTVVENDVHLDAIMRNRLQPPYIIDDIKLKLANLNINKIMDTVRDLDAELVRTQNIQSNIQPFDINQLVIKNSEISADKIKVRNIDANNFKANIKITDKHIIDVDNFKFDIAEGFVKGDFKYNINNQKTDLNISLDKANALVMSEALFDLKGQIYGSLNGEFNLSCIGGANENCFKTLSGAGNFKVANGRMPKLGSLEYLLKAGNLFKSGITGLSINSLVDLVTPLKTGNFESIAGEIHIKDGIADDINIYSSGEDLNMYMTGSYNILSSIADMKLVGSLSKKITTVFGKIKNASLNTLFNTIPGVNDANEKVILQAEVSKIPNINNAVDIYRIFAVDVNGDINGTDYVKSFKWVK